MGKAKRKSGQPDPESIALLLAPLQALQNLLATFNDQGVITKKGVFTFFLVLTTAISGCTNVSTISPTPIQEIVVKSVEGRTGPLLTHWEMGEESSIEIGKDSNLSILGFQLSELETKIYYTLSNISSQNLLDQQNIDLLGNDGTVYKLIKSILIKRVDNIDVGVLVFEPRYLGVSEMYLLMESIPDKSFSEKLLAVRFSGPPMEDRIKSQYSFRQEGGIKLNNYQVEMFLWSPISSQPSSSQEIPLGQTLENIPTSTPIIKTPYGMAAAGAIVTDEISIRIQDLIQKSSEIVTAQFLSDGTIFINDNNVITTPEIYFVPTAISPNTPYPDPTQ